MEKNLCINPKLSLIKKNKKTKKHLIYAHTNLSSPKLVQYFRDGHSQVVILVLDFDVILIDQLEISLYRFATKAGGTIWHGCGRDEEV